MSKQILYDHQIFVEQQYGGISRYFYELANTLNDDDEFSVRILAPFYINYYLKYAKKITIKGVYVPSIPRTGRAYRFINNMLSKSICSYIKPDLIHETYYNIHDHGHDCKIVTTIHDLIHERFPEYFFKNDEVLENKKKSIERADHIICVSNNTKNDLLRYYDIYPEKISVIHLGYSKKKYKNNDEENLIASPYILFVGSRAIYKNFSNLIKAYSESGISNDFSLVFFGGGKFSNREILEISNLEISKERITQLEGDDRLLHQLYSNASAYINPSIYEGFGIPLLEAMEYECPVICSNSSVFQEVAGNAAEYFDPYDIDSINNAIRNVLYSDCRKRKLIVSGIENKNKYSWGKCANETANIYKKLLE